MQVVLFTDVVDSTAMRSRHGDDVGDRVQDEHDHLVELLLADRGGRVVATTGDGVVAVLSAASDAISFAAELQLRLVERNREVAIPLRVRIGIAAGDVAEHPDGNISGLPVVEAARVCALASAEQVLVSDGVRALAGSRTDFRIEPVAEVHLKGLAEPTTIHAVAWSGDAVMTIEVPAPTPVGNLPSDTSSFVGRVDEIAEVATLVRTSRLTTLVGPGGAGKTRLSLEVARQLEEEHPGGAWFVDLVPVVDPRAVPTAVLRALGVVDEPGESSHDQLVNHLADAQALVVLDNAEHVLEGVKRLVADVLHADDGSARLLVTSRQRLHLSSEVVWTIPLMIDDGVSLYRERARQAGSRTAEDEAAVAQLVSQLDGLPLAIELAAARSRSLGPSDILERLRRGRTALAPGASDRHERQQSLDQLVTWSIDLLDDETRAAFHTLSSFAGAFDLELAEHVLGEETDALLAIEDLVDRSLLVEAPTGTGLRHHMLWTIREHAHDRRSEADQREATQRMLDALTTRFTDMDADSLWDDRRQEAVVRLDADRENVQAAVAPVPDGLDAARLRLALAAAPWWEAGGHFREGLTLLEDLADVDVSPQQRADRSIWHAIMAAHAGAEGAGDLYAAALRGRSTASPLARREVLLHAWYMDEGSVPSSTLADELVREADATSPSSLVRLRLEAAAALVGARSGSTTRRALPELVAEARRRDAVTFAYIAIIALNADGYGGETNLELADQLVATVEREGLVGEWANAAHFLRAQIHGRLDDLDAAEADMERGLSDSRAAGSNLNAATELLVRFALARRRGQHREALDCGQRLAALFPGTPQAALALASAGQDEAAVAELSRAIANTGEWEAMAKEAAARTAAVLLSRRGEHTLAVTWLRGTGGTELAAPDDDHILSDAVAALGAAAVEAIRPPVIDDQDGLVEMVSADLALDRSGG